VALIWLLWVGTSEWSVEQATFALRALLVWMLFSKFIKLVTHFVRYPVDILLWPVSILFGWFHGIIKVYAMVTLNEVRAPFHSNLSSNRSVPRPLKHLCKIFWTRCGCLVSLTQAFVRRGAVFFLAGSRLIYYSLQTTWGSRAGADASDSERMRKITEAKSSAICEKSSLIADEMKSRLSFDLKPHLSLRT